MPDDFSNINVFMLYAEEDIALKEELETHLSLLNSKGYIDIWHEGKIVYHKNVDAVISNYLQEAQIILLLISANFLAPDCYGKYEKELKKAYQRQQAGKTQIIPVILRPCVWQLDFLSGLEPLPKGGHPVRSRHWDNRDLAFQNIALGILNVVDELRRDPSPAGPPPLPFQKKSISVSPVSVDEMAKELIQNLFALIQRSEPNIGARRVKALVHKSLIVEDNLEANFKKYKFWKAYEKLHLYKIPVEIKNKKSSGRKSIGILLEKEDGEEWIYTLEKIEDLGGIDGQVRIFFSTTGAEGKITSISL